MGLILVIQLVSQMIYSSVNFELNMKIAELETKKVSLVNQKNLSYNQLYKQYSLTNINKLTNKNYVDITNTFNIKHDSYIASR